MLVYSIMSPYFILNCKIMLITSIATIRLERSHWIRGLEKYGSHIQ